MGYDKPVHHGLHVGFGFSILILWVYLGRKKIGEKWSRILMIAFTAGLLDILFHYFFTEPFETWVYFISKTLLLIVISYYLITLTDSSVGLRSAIGSIIFVVVFSLYYRVVEQIYSKGFGSRVPDIKFAGKVINYHDDMIASTFIWGLVHFFAYFVPSYYMFKTYERST